MLDWVLQSIEILWEAKLAKMRVRYGMEYTIVFSGLRLLHMPIREEWGPSGWIYEVSGIIPLAFDYKKIVFHMQTGDQVEIDFKSLESDIPENVFTFTTLHEVKT